MERGDAGTSRGATMGKVAVKAKMVLVKGVVMMMPKAEESVVSRESDRRADTWLVRSGRKVNVLIRCHRWMDRRVELWPSTSSSA